MALGEYPYNDHTSISTFSYDLNNPCIGGHSVDPTSYLQYPDGEVVCLCSGCGQRILLRLTPEDLLLRRVAQVGVEVAEADPETALHFVETFHSLWERMGRAKRQVSEAESLLTRMKESLDAKVRRLCE